MCSTYSQIIEATGEAYGLTQSSYALPAWRHMKKEFPHTVSYNRFVERQAQVALHLLLFLQTCALGKCTGISIIDSTPLVSCHIKRMHMHKTMKGWAAKGKCTMGWFYGSDLLLRR